MHAGHAAQHVSGACELTRGLWSGQGDGQKPCTLAAAYTLIGVVYVSYAYLCVAAWLVWAEDRCIVVTDCGQQALFSAVVLQGRCEPASNTIH